MICVNAISSTNLASTGGGYSTSNRMLPVPSRLKSNHRIRRTAETRWTLTPRPLPVRRGYRFIFPNSYGDLFADDDPLAHSPPSRTDRHPHRLRTVTQDFVLTAARSAHLSASTTHSCTRARTHTHTLSPKPLRFLEARTTADGSLIHSRHAHVADNASAHVRTLIYIAPDERENRPSSSECARALRTNEYGRN